MSSQIRSGNILHGIEVSDHKFQGVSSIDQLENFGLAQPSEIENLTQKDVRHNRADKDAKDMRDLVQRRFDKARKERADFFSRYIEKCEVDNSLKGGTPAITLYVKRVEGTLDEGIVLPYNATLICLDGETQTEARFKLRDRYPETGSNAVAVTLYHDIGFEHAQQILHDYNMYAFPVSEQKLAGLNHGGGLSKAISEACHIANFTEAELNRAGNTSTKKTVAAYSQLLSAAAGYALNGDALARTVSGATFKQLNSPSVPSLLGAEAAPKIAEIMSQLRQHPERGKMNAMIWQVAGALIGQGREPKTLDWDAAQQVYEATKSPKKKTGEGRGGPRMPARERLSKLAEAM